MRLERAPGVSASNTLDCLAEQEYSQSNNTTLSRDVAVRYFHDAPSWWSTSTRQPEFRMSTAVTRQFFCHRPSECLG